MKIKSIELEGFKRFKDLTIGELPETARLIVMVGPNGSGKLVMVGPNGSGKSSVFEALHRYKLSRGSFTIQNDPYYVKIDSTEPLCRVRKVDFHTGEPRNRTEWAKSIHIRTVVHTLI